MSKIRRCIIHARPRSSKRKIALKIFILAAMISIGAIHFPVTNESYAASCPDLKVIFARGSGAERYTSGHYLAFRSSMEAKLKTSRLTYEIDDLDYPAISIGVADGHLGTLINAYIGGGEAYDFGDSVHAGTKELLRVVNHDKCPNTKYVLGGYSQGAIVLLDALKKIDPSRVIYVATFGDPKIYLPEGAGPVPTACSGKGLSPYRIYVPDCKAYKGILGARNPYTVSGYENKIGTWCNKYDILCSSYSSVKSHTSYAEDGIYEDASRFIFSKIAKAYNFKNQYTSPHDTAILIDSTGSMGGLISKYKNEALRLAEKTLNTGGRVALYDYRDVGEGYVPVEHCNFETCNLTTFQSGLDSITPEDGGDTPESVLSASFHVMKSLKWKFGSTKSLVILTDASYHSPDLDGTTFYDVVKLSKQIDPVNFYIITTSDSTSTYQSLADETGGAVASTVDDLSILTDTIMGRYDSLPRVEEFEDDGSSIPTLKITSIEEVSDAAAKISFTTDGARTIVIINDAIMGAVEGNSLTIGGLDYSRKNVISLVPLSADRRGDPVTADLNTDLGRTDPDPTSTIIPKAPNTGKR